MNTDTPNIQKALFAIRALGMVVVRSGRNQTLNSDYATYADIWKMLQTPLADHKLAVGFLPGEVHKEGEKTTTFKDGPNVESIFKQHLTITVMHESGESFSQEFDVLLPDANRATNRTMCQGMAQTYGKRYALVNMFNLIVGNDEDAELLGQEREDAAEASPDVDAHWRQYCHCPNFDVGSEEHRGAWAILSNPENAEQNLGEFQGPGLAKLWMRHPNHPGINAWRAELVDDRAIALNLKSWDLCRTTQKSLSLPEFFTDCTGQHLANLALALNPNPIVKKKP